MIKTRFKSLQNGDFRIYFDNYDSITKKRKYKFTKLHVSKDYSKSNENGKKPNFTALDRTTMNKAEKLKSTWRENLESGTDLIVNKNLLATDYIDKFEKLYPHLTPVIVSFKSALFEYADKSILLRVLNTAKWIKDFNAWLRINRRYSTRKGILWTLKRTLRDAVIDEQIIHVNLDHAFKVPSRDKPEPEIKYFTKEQVIKLKETAFRNEHLKQAFLFSCGTGLRLSDLIRLKWSNIKKDKLTVTPYKTRTKGVQLKILLSQLAKDALKVMSKDKNGDQIFWDMPQNRTGARLLIIDWTKEAELPSASMHWARHTFAVLALNSGISITSVQKLMGHADLITTMKYAKLLDTTANDEMDKKFPKI